MFLAAELARERVRSQRPLLVSLAKRVRAQLAESIGVLSTHVTVMPGTIPATWKKTRSTNVKVVNVYHHIFKVSTFDNPRCD